MLDQGGIRGRAKEIASLEKLYDDCSQVSKVVIVEGKTGVGKTALVTSNQVLFVTDGYFVVGTFDLQRRSEPFSAIGDVMADLFEEILIEHAEAVKSEKSSVVKDIIQQFNKETNKDAGMRTVLQNAFPKFTELLQVAKDEERFEKACLDTSNHSKGHNQIRRRITSNRTTTPKRNTSYKKGWNFERLKMSLRILLRCICKPHRRVVIFLDDLHYADTSSFEMIEFLASGDGLSTPASAKEAVETKSNVVEGLLLLLGFRNDKNAKPGHSIAIEHPFRQRLKELKQLNCPIHRIHVKDLPVDAVNDIVASILGYSAKPQTTLPLAQILFKKTAGNPDSVLQMLEFLEHEQLIYFSLNEYKWEWRDVRTIHSATNLSDNIVDIVAIKLRQLPPATQEILKLGSCLGSYFRLEVVAAYFRKYNDKHHKIDFAQAAESARIENTVELEPLGKVSEGEQEQQEDKRENKAKKTQSEARDIHGMADTSQNNLGSRSILVERMIELLQLPLKQDMLTKRRKSTTYFFAHERLQQAAYSLLPSDDTKRKEIHWRLGKLMKEKSQQFPDEHWMAYLATDQLNRGLIFLHDTSERFELATMNLHIAMMSQEKSAFFPAAGFLRSAIRLIFEENVQDPLPRLDHNGNGTRSDASSLYKCGRSHHCKIWKDHYELCLDLFSSLAEMEYLLGHHKSSKVAVDELLRNARTEEDKFRAQVILIESISAQRDFDAAIETILKILETAYDMKLSGSPMKLQIKAEKNRVNRMLDSQLQQDGLNASIRSASVDLFNSSSSTTTSMSSASRLPKPKNIFRSKSTDASPKLPGNENRFRRAASSDKISSAREFHKKQEKVMMTLPKMTDDKCIRVSKLLSQLMQNAILSGNSDLSAYIGLRSIRFSFQNGISPHSPMALAAYGISQAKEGKYNAAYADGELALKLLDVADSREWYTRTILKCHNLRHIKKPFHESLDPMMAGYRTGIESGDLEYALVAAMQYSLLYLFVGLPLGPLEADLLSFAEQVHRYHLPYVLELTFYVYREYVLDLQGEEHDKICLDDDETVRSGERSNGSASRHQEPAPLDQKCRPLIKREMCMMNLQRACLFGELEMAEQIIQELSELPNFDYSVLRTIMRDSMIGLVYLRLAKSTGKKKYRDKGRKIVEEFETYAKHGSVNSHHMLMLLRAEDHAISASSGDWKATSSKYDEAIKSACRSGFTSHEALANELAGRYFFRLGKDRPKDSGIMDQAKRHISRAMALYKEWGAEAKVEQLESEFPMFQPSKVLQGVNIKARRRFSKTLTARFRDMKLHSGRWSVGASSDLKILDGFDELKE